MPQADSSFVTMFQLFNCSIVHIQEMAGCHQVEAAAAAAAAVAPAASAVMHVSRWLSILSLSAKAGAPEKGIQPGTEVGKLLNTCMNTFAAVYKRRLAMQHAAQHVRLPSTPILFVWRLSNLAYLAACCAASSSSQTAAKGRRQGRTFHPAASSSYTHQHCC